MPIKKQGKHIAVPSCSCDPRQTRMGSGGESDYLAFEGELSACFICRSPVLSTTHSHKARESLAIGLKPGEHAAHEACGVEWPWEPCGYLAMWLRAQNFFPSSCMKVELCMSHRPLPCAGSGVRLA